MNKKPDGSQSFDFNDLTLKQLAISNDLTLKQPAIDGDWLIELKPPTISDNLMQMLIHHLIPPNLNRNNEN